MRMDLVYTKLLEHYGYQGWWPLVSMKGKKGFDNLGYHPNDYSYPKTRGQMFEIIIGAILTQNTAWKNVEKALINLYTKRVAVPEKIIEMDFTSLATLIRSAGYYNQKTVRLKTIAEWFNSTNFNIPTLSLRKKLLSLKGVGPETADSILLYAFKRPVFVVDAYTLRMFERLGFGKLTYDSAQGIVHKSFKTLSDDDKVKVFNEFHALIVAHAKEHCKKRPMCEQCPLYNLCKMNGKR
ncbi:endonuclease III domain-containing protein [Candidatus Micrarchaeota archaeon]|nr:endonuclease III domain-containing protein [Candidatus Micrarchaeota archaeon]